MGCNAASPGTIAVPGVFASGGRSSRLGEGGGSSRRETSRGTRSCSNDATDARRGSLMPQRRGAPSSSTLASATMVMPWWWAITVLTGVLLLPPVWRSAVKSIASTKPIGPRACRVCSQRRLATAALGSNIAASALA